MATGGWIGAAATTALRRKSPDELAGGIARYLQVIERTQAASGDPRDVIAGLAPFLDCARRLGEDPVPLFDQAAARVAPDLGEVARSFGRRDDVTLEAFGWALEDSPAGAEYVVIRPLA